MFVLSCPMRKFYLLSFLFNLLIQFSWSQTKKVYEGDYTYLGKQGKAEFEYVLNSASEQVKDGRFYFELSERKDNGQSDFLKRTYSGSFVMNSRNGIWEVMEENLIVKIKDIVDLDVKADLSGVQSKITAQYKNGLPEGSWTFERNLIEGGNVSQSVQSDRIFFKNGKLSNRLEFRVINGKTAQFVRGRLAEGGVMTGEWTLSYTSGDRLINEVRNYENGFLLGVVRRDLLTGEVLDEVVFFDTIDKLNAIRKGTQKGFRVADEYFDLEYTDGFLSEDSKALVQKEGNAFLQRFLTNLLAHDPAFSDQEGNVKSLPIHTKRMVYELSRANQKAVEELPDKFQELKDLYEKELNDPAFRLNRYQNDSLAFAFKYFELQNEKMASLDELFSLVETKQIQYYDLEILAESVSFNFPDTEEIRVKLDEGEKSMSFTYSKKDFQVDFYSALNQSLDEIREKTLGFLAYADKELTTIRQNEELVNLSRELDLKRKEVIRLYEETKEDGLVAIAEKLKERFLINQMELEESALANSGGFEDRKANYNRIDLFLETMAKVHEQLGVWVVQKNELDQIYQEETFNPFTYSRYNQRVKPRLFETYEELFDYYYASFLEEGDFSNLTSWIVKVQKLGDRMRELRNAETKKLERSLNKANTISKMESQLGL